MILHFKKSVLLDQLTRPLIHNYAFICKQYYLSLLDKELKNSTTFKACKLNYNNICKKIISINTFFKINNSCIKLPYITVHPKFHKNPIAFRFIICGTSSYLTKPVDLFFNLLKKLETFVTLEGYTWIINNNKPVLDFINDN